jgi:hypothetical protein
MAQLELQSFQAQNGSFLKGFYSEMNQLELQGFQAQNASFPYWILLRNGPVGAPKLPGSECFTFLKDFIKKWLSWSSKASRLRMLHFLKDSIINWPVGALNLPNSDR